MRVLLMLLAWLLPSLAGAASSVQPLTATNTSVMGGERQVYSARFFDALGRPAAGENVTFANDACGFFDNGAFAIVVPTDASGVASAPFTARPQGITCWVTAQAGVSARFNVFTYTLGQVGLVGSIVGGERRAGQSFGFDAVAAAGAYPIHGARVDARAVPAGAAQISGGGESGPGRTSYEVIPAGNGAFEIEMSYRGITRRVAVPALDSPWQDMWWSGLAENGWGMSLVQHGDRIFACIYAYDAAGVATWYVIPGGTWNADKTVFSGTVYWPHGSPYWGYDASKFSVGPPVGTASLSFGASGATLEYTINGISGRKAITRQPFGPVETTAAPQRVGDMWWGGPSQNGWGIALLQQYRTVFGVWFTYDEKGAPTWFVMPSGYWADDRTWEGRLYRTRGPDWVGQPYDASKFAIEDVGGFALRFDGGEATLTYAVGEKRGTIPLMRMEF
jgi:hypothetical protein